MQNSDGRVRIWRKQHECMGPSCLVATARAAASGGMVWRIHSWHPLDTLVPIENCAAYLSIVGDSVHPFMTTVSPSSDGYYQEDNVTCHHVSKFI